MNAIPVVVTVMPVSYKVSVWPPAVRCLDQSLWCVTVVSCSYGNWAVLRGENTGADPDGGNVPVLGSDMRWHREKQPSERTAGEILRNRFTFGEAMELAKAMAPKVELNGLTAAEAVARHEAKGHCIGCEGPYTA